MHLELMHLCTSHVMLKDKILALKKQRDAVIIAHNYQLGEIQDIADYVGDSLGMAKFGSEHAASTLAVCGVHFMAETAKILNPEKTVLIPELSAGCSLAECVDAEQVRSWKKNHPGTAVVAYVNTSAAVKAESDICCTSSNALKIVESLPQDQEILFIPDMYLGHWLRTKTRRKIQLWNGSCHTHVRIKPETIQELRDQHPNAEFLMHPECGCLTASMQFADQILSTDGILRHVLASPKLEFIIATETGILHRLKKENPGKVFYPAAEDAYCEFMKKITLEKLLWSLEDMEFQITLPDALIVKARKALDRMMSVSFKG